MSSRERSRTPPWAFVIPFRPRRIVICLRDLAGNCIPHAHAGGQDDHDDTSKKMLHRSNGNLGVEHALGGQLEAESVENLRDNLTLKKGSVADSDAEKEQLRTKIFELEAALKEKQKQSSLCSVL